MVHLCSSHSGHRTAVGNWLVGITARQAPRGHLDDLDKQGEEGVEVVGETTVWRAGMWSQKVGGWEGRGEDGPG